MFGAGWLNIGSLVLGLVAWVLPVVSLVRRNQAAPRKGAVYSGASFGACAVSLCLQIVYTDQLVRIEDWSALADTSRAVTLVSVLFLVITIVLNLIPLMIFRGEK